MRNPRSQFQIRQRIRHTRRKIRRIPLDPIEELRADQQPLQSLLDSQVEIPLGLARFVKRHQIRNIRIGHRPPESLPHQRRKNLLRASLILRLTDENLFPYVESEISGNTLRLRTREQIRPTHGITVSIASPTREAAKIRGAVKLAASQLTGPRFALEGTGASRVSLDGNIDQLLADVTGASDLKAGALQTKTAEISIQGAGDAEVAVAEKLKVAIAGAGKVSYSGDPPTIEKHISGVGSLRHKD